MFANSATAYPVAVGSHPAFGLERVAISMLP